MEQLTIKELAPYLPFNLKCKTKQGVFELNTIDNSSRYKVWFKTSNNYHKQDFNYKLLIKLGVIGRGYFIKQVKPILRPLSDLNLTKVKELFGSQISDFRYEKIDDFSFEVYTESIGWTGLGYSDYTLFFENHFDVFNLLEKGLAIDIKTIK
jgi:hypothetical protein